MNFAGLVPPALKSNVIYRGIRDVALYRQSDHYRRLRQQFRRDSRRIRRYLATTAEPKIQFGCGHNVLDGWLNADFYPEDPAIIHVDLTARFPLPDDCAALIFSEHVIEHLPLAGGIKMMRECFRVLRPGGRMRISTPSLPTLIAIHDKPDVPLHRAYLDWHAKTWLANSEILTPAIVLNDFARNWGHLLIYDQPTLEKILMLAGFEQIQPCKLQESTDARLAGLENDTRMPAGLLALHTMTFEAIKPLSARTFR